MLKNLFGSHVPSDLVLLEDAQSIQIKLNILVHWQYAALIYVTNILYSMYRMT
jgi:hypothetical protein